MDDGRGNRSGLIAIYHKSESWWSAAGYGDARPPQKDGRLFCTVRGRTKQLCSVAERETGPRPHCSHNQSVALRVPLLARLSLLFALLSLFPFAHPVDGGLFGRVGDGLGNNALQWRLIVSPVPGSFLDIAHSDNAETASSNSCAATCIGLTFRSAVLSASAS